MDGVLEVVVNLARVVAHAQLADARQTLQLVLVEYVTAVVGRQVSAVVPRLPEEAGQQRPVVRRRRSAHLHSGGKLSNAFDSVCRETQF